MIFVFIAVGAFLFAYFTINLLVGLPCYFLELGLGQFTGNAPTHAFEMAPFWKGLSIELMYLRLNIIKNFPRPWLEHGFCKFLLFNVL